MEFKLKITSYANAFILQVNKNGKQRVETVGVDNKIKVRKSMFAAKWCLTHELTVARKNEMKILEQIRQECYAGTKVGV